MDTDDSVRQQVNIVKNGKSQRPDAGMTIRGLAGPFAVMGQNFAPGTTAADVESAMTPVGGEMVSCEVVKTQPFMIVEMVFASREGGERVIETFNNKTVRPRAPLLFTSVSSLLTIPLQGRRQNPQSLRQARRLQTKPRLSIRTSIITPRPGRRRLHGLPRQRPHGHGERAPLDQGQQTALRRRQEQLRQQARSRVPEGLQQRAIESFVVGGVPGEEICTILNIPVFFFFQQPEISPPRWRGGFSLLLLLCMF